MSLLQDVLKPNAPPPAVEISNKFENLNVQDPKGNTPPATPPVAAPAVPTIEKTGPAGDDQDAASDDDLISVRSLPGTPHDASRIASGANTPARGAGGAHSRLNVSSTAASQPSKRAVNRADPIRVLPSHMIQSIFSTLSVKDLARASLVCKKWNKSQSLNYVWFQYHRKDEFGDTSLPTGKWTRRESKENWRRIYFETKRHDSDLNVGESRYGYSTNTSGASPGDGSLKDQREARWAEQNAAAMTAGNREARVASGKNEMREYYKELQGRKPKSKDTKPGAGDKDRGGWSNADDVIAPN